MISSDQIKRITGGSVTPTATASTASSMGKAWLQVMQSAESIEPWGGNWARRDSQLRNFVTTEPFVLSSIHSIAATRAAFSWHIDGPPRTAKQVSEMLHRSEKGDGWVIMMLKLVFDVLTQDNGGFLEIVREDNRNYRSKVLGLLHLDSAKCVRTADPLKPVIYVRDDGEPVVLNWWQVITFEDMPHPADSAKGRQLSFLSRVLKGAEIIREITKYKHEKVSGRFSRALHLVGGVAKGEIDRVKNQANMDADNAGLSSYMEPIIMAALDPNATVSHVRLDLASLPDGFDEETSLTWYITLIALASGGDFQDFAPLPGGNLGTASQSEILHRKSSQRGHAMWVKQLEHKFRLYGVIPANITFAFGERDAVEEAQRSAIEEARARTRAARIQSGEITLQVARQIASDDGDLKPEYLAVMSETDVTPSVSLTDTSAVEQIDMHMPNGDGDETSIPLSIADVVAQKFVHTIAAHPVQAVSPIPDNKLLTFFQSLREAIHTGRKEVTIGTDSSWMHFMLTAAAQKSGIAPTALRLRLPDNFHIKVRANDAVSSDGVKLVKHSVKEVLPLEVRKSAGIFCYKSGGASETFIYLPFRRWVPVRKQYATNGFVGNPSGLQADFQELQQQAKKQLEDATTTTRMLGILTSAVFYAYELGSEEAVTKENTEAVNILRGLIRPYLKNNFTTMMPMVSYTLGQAKLAGSRQRL